MEERRRFVRLDTRLDVTYSVLSTGAPQGTRTKNVSGGGVCIFSDRPLPAGTRLQLSVKLPGRERPMQATAEVVWSEAYEVIGQGGMRQKSVETGIRFVDITPRDQEAIMQHVILSMTPLQSP